MKEQFMSKKFIGFIFVTLVLLTLVLTGKAEADAIISFITLNFGFYIGGNITEKIVSK